MAAWTEAEVAELAELESRGMSHAEIAEEIGRPERGVACKLHKLRKNGKLPGRQRVESPRAKSKVSDSEGGYVIQVDRKPPTVESALTSQELDVDDWIIDSKERNSWDAYIKGKGDTIVTAPMYSLRLKLKPNPEKWAIKAADYFAKRHKDHKPDYGGWQPPTKAKGDWLAVVGLFDVHFGKLAWAGESGENYDLRIAQQDYRRAIDQMIAAAAPYSIAKWRMSVGQDFLHIDSTSNSTTAGTPQDTDGRYPKIVCAATETIVEAVDKLMKVAPVLIEYDASNHDRHTAWHIAHTLAAHYRNVKGVEVNTGWQSRKYLLWGKNLLGICHGDKTKPAELVTKMPAEQSESFAKAIHREWLLGHIHHEKVYMAKEANEQDGVYVRYMRSLSATDKWHYEQGYLTDRAAELHLYHRSGLQQIRSAFRVPARKEKR